jgi:hypothetical protein
MIATVTALSLPSNMSAKALSFPSFQAVSMAIPSGIYGYPKQDALRVATDAIRGFLNETDMDVTLGVFDKEALTASEGLLLDVARYIDKHYVDEHIAPRRRRLEVEEKALAEVDELRQAPMMSELLAPSMAAPASLDDLVGDLDEPFSTTLMRLIDAKGFKKDAEAIRLVLAVHFAGAVAVADMLLQIVDLGHAGLGTLDLSGEVVEECGGRGSAILRHGVFGQAILLQEDEGLGPPEQLLEAGFAVVA